VKHIFSINFKAVFMQPAQHAANNFQILSCGLHKIKAFSIISAEMPHLFGKFWSISWPKIEIVTNVLQIG